MFEKKGERGKGVPASVGKKAPTSFATAVAVGGVSGGIEACVMFPTEFVKTQLQLDKKGTKV